MRNKFRLFLLKVSTDVVGSKFSLRFTIAGSFSPRKLTAFREPFIKGDSHLLIFDSVNSKSSTTVDNSDIGTLGTIMAAVSVGVDFGEGGLGACLFVKPEVLNEIGVFGVVVPQFVYNIIISKITKHYTTILHELGAPRNMQ